MLKKQTHGKLGSLIARKKVVTNADYSFDTTHPYIDRDSIAIVALLNVLGFPTWRSCYGHAEEDHRYTGANCGPYLEIVSAVALELRVAALMQDAFTKSPPLDLALHHRQAAEIRVLQNRLLDLLQDFYDDRRVSEAVRIVVSRPDDHSHSFILASQGAWADYAPGKRRVFLRQSQEEFTAFAVLLHQQYLTDA